MPFPSVALVDDFNRANESPVVGWTTNVGTGLRIQSNIVNAISGTDYAGAAWPTSYGPNCEVALTVAQLPGPNYQIVYVRKTDAADFESDHYEFDIVTVAGSSNDTMEIWKQVGGVQTQLGATISLGADITVNDQWGGSAIGTTLEIFLNGVSKGTRTDGDVTGAGYTGIVISPATPVMYGDNFYAGTVSGGSFQPAWTRGANIIMGTC